MKTKLLLSAFFVCTVWMSYGQWTYDSLTQPRNWMGATAFGNKIYFAGGETDLGVSSDVEIFNVATGVWETPESLSSARSTLSAVACDSLVFFAGGFTNNIAVSTIDIFDTRTQQWTVEQLTIPRFAISAVSKDNKVLFAGGVIYNLTGYNRVDIYNTQTGIWSTASLSIARGAMASAIVGDLAIFAGGINQAGTTDRVDIYNFATDTWSIATLSLARFQAEAVTLGHKVFIAGGMTGINGVRSDRIDIYDAETNLWSTASLSYARTSACAAALNGRAYFIGGGKFGNNAVLSDFSDVIDIYDTFTDSWSVDHLSEPLMTHSVACVGNQIFVAGGKTIGNQRVKTVEIFTDPSLIHVPADYPSIQQGIDAATAGDTVLVDPGIYYENINFLGKKPLMVASHFILDGDTNHINNTIINGSQPVNPDIGSVVIFGSGEDTTSVLCGFSITGGTGTIEPSVNYRMGGGLHISYSGAKILNNNIHNNTITFDGQIFGGGMQFGGPISEIPWIVLRGNRIYDNQAVSTFGYASGGGFICFYNLIMENNVVSGNVANGYLGGDGGGMECMGAFGPIELQISHNSIQNNEANSSMGSSAYAGLGGGLAFVFDCWGTIKNNIISNNSLQAPDTYKSWGPGVFIQDIYTDNFVFENNVVIENLTNSENSCGGGLSLLRAGGKYQNNVLQHNSAFNGGGISIEESKDVNATAILINNTITANGRGGMYISLSDAVVINSILYNNTPPGPAIHAESSYLEVVYSDVDDDEFVYPGEGNINIDPAFLEDGYHLSNTSQLLEKGIASILINGTLYDCPAFDIDGEGRPLNEFPEIGTDEVLMVPVAKITPKNRSSLSIYPNPTSGKITIEYNGNTSDKGNITIIGMTGKALHHQLIIGPKTELNVSALPAGVYFIKLISNDQNSAIKVGKFIKY